jgi:hypothetical protein
MIYRQPLQQFAWIFGSLKADLHILSPRSIYAAANALITVPNLRAFWRPVACHLLDVWTVRNP